MVTNPDIPRKTIRDHSVLGRWWYRVFLEHPHAAGETYFEHLGFAWSVAGVLLRAALAAFLHGGVPSIHTRTAGEAISRLYRKLEPRLTVSSR